MKVYIYNYLKLKKFPLKLICRTYSSLDLEIKEIDKDLFPPIKPKYPLGLWSPDLDSKSAWAIKEYSDKLLGLVSAKEKLEHLAGEEPTLLWLVKASTDRVKNLNFYKYITKTNIIKGLPDCFSKVDISNHLKFEKVYIDNFADEFKCFARKSKSDTQTNESNNKHYAIGNLLRKIISRTTPISKNCVLDENVRIESFWRVSGFIDNKSAKGTWDVTKLNGDLDAGFLQFQFQQQANYQIRSLHPLPEFLMPSDTECNGKFSLSPEYSPHIIGLESINERPISVSGHWIGSKYPFSIGCVYLMSEDENSSKHLNEEIIDEAELQYATAACFASCRAQAANHGFNDFLDVTYPMTTTCLLVNKNRMRLFSYQLNSMQVWNTANPLNNVLFATPPVQLHDGTNYTLANEALELILKFVSLQPADRGIDYQPYIYTEDKDEPVKLKINIKGEEVIDQPPVERFKYPKSSVYYRTFI